jgi:hypothetical protein
MPAALAVPRRPGAAGGAGHRDDPDRGRRSPARADRVRPAVGPHPSGDRHRAAEPAALRLVPDQGATRGQRPDDVRRRQIRDGRVPAGDSERRSAARRQPGSPDHRTAGGAPGTAAESRPGGRGGRQRPVPGELRQGRRRHAHPPAAQPPAGPVLRPDLRPAGAGTEDPGPHRRGDPLTLVLRSPRIPGRRHPLASAAGPLPRQPHGRPGRRLHQRAGAAQRRRRGDPPVPRRSRPGDRPLGHRHVGQLRQLR